MNEIVVNFEGKEHNVRLTSRKHHSYEFFYVALTSQELINRFSIAYLFGYTKYVGLKYMSSIQDPRNEPMVENLKKALLPYIQNGRLNDAKME